MISFFLSFFELEDQFVVFEVCLCFLLLISKHVGS